ncbi:uncharacterized protein LOC107470765 [Arachis duranensis]|uniref:Uncharacterized protein LOC107470765 n=1 Tax=Arachis duranensis TaxID=130453 RepID=A0A6P4BTJ9_ARADU|nr:uncharacterized protein LOC107470765 [Arachis duranensis]
MYDMPNFIVKINNGKVRTTAHKYKLSFYTKTDVEVLPIETFAFNPFKMCPFAELEANALMDKNLLFDYIGKVVGKKEAMGMITRTSEESKRIALQLKDLEHMLDIKCPKILLELYYAFHSKKHKIKCTLFGKSVDQVLPHFERDDGEPFIMFVQLFKSNVYLNSMNVQSTYYVSKCYFNPNLPEVIDFKKRFAKEETSYWIVENIVSLKVGKDDWSYTPCKTCPEKVLESKNRYWCDHCRRVGFKATLRYKLQVIVTNENGCMKLFLWNKETEHMVGKTAEIIKELFLNITYKNINVVEGVYSVLKISDDECLMSSFGSANSSFDASCSQHVPNTSTTEIGDNSNGHGAVSLSKDLAVEGNGERSSETPAKRSSPNTGDGSTAEASVSADVQASINKNFKRNCGKKISIENF